MVLNLFPKKDSGEEAGAESTNDKSEASTEEAPSKPPARRRTRRSRTADAAEGDTRETRAKEDESADPAPRRRRSSSRSRKTDDAAEAQAEETPRRTRRVPAKATAPAPEVDFGPLLKAVEKQNEQLARLIELQEAANHGDGASAQPARVGIFVDSANVELAADRVKKKIDWNKVLARLTKDRRLIRAVSYSPTHDDPGVSMETQRFVEPFLDAGFKIVTKPLKRFADGSIKANVDIELALDIMSMCDRLDIVCLVSGDGDFQHLVEVVQSRGVRVEVVGYGGSVAGALRRAADEYLDLETMFGGSTTRRGRRN